MTPNYYNKTFNGVKLDPYRIAKVYGIKGGPREHILKKLLRGLAKEDQSQLDLISEIRLQLDRWEEMFIKGTPAAQATFKTKQMSYCRTCEYRATIGRRSSKGRNLSSENPNWQSQKLGIS